MIVITVSTYYAILFTYRKCIEYNWIEIYSHSRVSWNKQRQCVEPEHSYYPPKASDERSKDNERKRARTGRGVRVSRRSIWLNRISDACRVTGWPIKYAKIRVYSYTSILDNTSCGYDYWMVMHIYIYIWVVAAYSIDLKYFSLNAWYLTYCMFESTKCSNVHFLHVNGGAR